MRSGRVWGRNRRKGTVICSLPVFAPSPVLFAAALFVFACGPHTVPDASSGHPAPPAAAVHEIQPVAVHEPPPAAAASPVPVAPPVIEIVAPAPAEVPAKSLTRTATWPFVAWDRAEAIAYNHVGYGPGIPLRVYDDTHGWSPKISERKPIARPQGERAVTWVIATGGAVEVSKCAFPRHAVVLYSGDTPVGTANVCFECGDILVWPDLDPPPDYEHWTDAAQKQHERSYRRKLAAYKKVFPKWERFFRDELGLPLTPVLGSGGGLNP